MDLFDELDTFPSLGESSSNPTFGRMEKLQRLYELDIYPYGDKFNWTHYAKAIMDHYDSLKDTAVSVSGRIMAKRDHGKTMFLTLRDTTGDIQIFARKDEVSDLEDSLLDLLDVGDIIGVNGTVFKTDSGEISIRTNHVELLTKSLRPLPDKWHGLKNAEFKYRHRYVDLIMNPQVLKYLKSALKLLAPFASGCWPVILWKWKRL